MLLISGKALGRRKQLFADWSIPFPPELGDGGTITLRNLITRVVRAEVQAFRDRQEERRLLHCLTAGDIESGIVRGKVDAGGVDNRKQVNDDEAVAVALQAFEDGLYLVIIDEQEASKLDQQVILQPDSRVTFVRLTMLAGG